VLRPTKANTGGRRMGWLCSWLQHLTRLPRKTSGDWRPWKRIASSLRLIRHQVLPSIGYSDGIPTSPSATGSLRLPAERDRASRPPLLSADYRSDDVDPRRPARSIRGVLRGQLRVRPLSRHAAAGVASLESHLTLVCRAQFRGAGNLRPYACGCPFKHGTRSA
jgi:hypothetical protein